MRRIKWLLIAVALVTAMWNHLVSAQVLSPGFFERHSSSYVGPGDRYSTSVIFFGGFQAWSAATAGTKAVNVCNSTGGVDVACADWSTSASTGLIVPTLISGFSCAGVTVCTVKIIYNQSGGSGSDAVIAGVGGRAQVVSNCLGTAPCMNIPGASEYYTVTVSVTAPPISLGSIYNSTSGSNILIADTANNPAWYENAANTLRLFNNSGGNFTATSADNAWHVGEASENGASSYIYVDATETTGTAGTNVTGTSITLGAGPLASGSVEFETMGIWGSAMPAVTAALICHDAFLFWGTPTSC